MKQPIDKAAYEQQRVDNYNATAGTLTDYDCPKCRNRGHFAWLREDLSMAFYDCDCMNTRRALQKLASSGLSKSVKDLTFEKYQATEPWQRYLKQGAMAFAGEEGGWMLISGRSGIGKTHLCTAVCQERIFRHQFVRYMGWREEIPGLKFSGGDEEAREQLLRELKTVQVLYIDDLFKTAAGPDGKCRPTQADVNLAYDILNYRYLNDLSTLISTEKSIEELLHIDEATGSRILERCGKHVYFVKRQDGKNYRLRKG